MRPNPTPALLMVLLACGPDQRPPAPAETAPVGAAGDSVERPMAARDSVDRAREDEIVLHLREFRAADERWIARRYPEYRREMEETLADFEREMTEMTLDSREWRTRLADVRADLARMDTMAPARLRRAWPAHARRVEELVHLHAWMNGRARVR